jgi:hypothetical protein
MDMKAPWKCLIATMFALPAFAQESSSLRLKPRLMSSDTVAAWRASDEAIAATLTPAPLFSPDYIQRDQMLGSCELSGALMCYDRRNGIAFKPSRNLMPEISGMQREGISLKRDKITFKYSFR